jgi:hypothetical protein
MRSSTLPPPIRAGVAFLLSDMYIVASTKEPMAHIRKEVIGAPKGSGGRLGPGEAFAHR